MEVIIWKYKLHLNYYTKSRINLLFTWKTPKIVQRHGYDNFSKLFGSIKKFHILDLCFICNKQWLLNFVSYLKK